MLNYLLPTIITIIITLIFFKFIKSTIKTIVIFAILLSIFYIIFSYLSKNNIIHFNLDLNTIKKTGLTIIDLLKEKIGTK